jgi:hypothetical protein
MTSRVLLSGGVNVHYAQIYVQPPNAHTDMTGALGGQVNGICGASQEGHLFLVTGLHTGLVRLTVTLHENEPDLDPSWEEVVEVPFPHMADKLALVEWGSDDGHDLSIPPGTYRARYSARSMLGDWQITEQNAPTQTYSLDFWPAPLAPDAIIRVTGECAKYWHSEAAKNREA